jgi:hypothetical protein
MLKAFLIFLLSCTVCFSEAHFKSCLLCHFDYSSCRDGKGSILKKWYQASPSQRYGHIWLDSDRLRRLILDPMVWKSETPEKPEFFSRVLHLQKKASEQNWTEEDSDTLKALMEQGKKEIPVADRIWTEGNRLADLKLAMQILTYTKSLLTPFAHLYLKENETVQFENSSKLRVGRIMFLFGGMKQDMTYQLQYQNQGYTGNGYKGHFHLTRYHNNKPEHKTITECDYLLTDRGKIQSTSNPDPKVDAIAKNMLEMLFRFQHSQFDDLKGIRNIYFETSGPLRREVVPMDMDSTIEGLQLLDDEPVMKISFKLKEKEPQGPLRFTGYGTVLITMDGLFTQLDNRVDLQASVLGLPILKGHSSNTMDLK